MVDKEGEESLRYLAELGRRSVKFFCEGGGKMLQTIKPGIKSNFCGRQAGIFQQYRGIMQPGFYKVLKWVNLTILYKNRGSRLKMPLVRLTIYVIKIKK